MGRGAKNPQSMPIGILANKTSNTGKKMRLKKFFAEDVYGFLDFNIEFNSDLSFITGGNGSGKTTALRIINSLLTANYGEISQIPFKYAALELEINGSKIKIEALSINKEEIQIQIFPENSKLIFNKISEDELKFSSRNGSSRDEFIENTNRKYISEALTKQISKIPSPIFLGLDRRQDGESTRPINYYSEREHFMELANKKYIGTRRPIHGSLGTSLMETEFLVQSSYRRVKRLEERQSEKLKNKIIKSAFSYYDFNFAINSFNSDFWGEKSKLLQRKIEIKEAISKIDVTDSKLMSEIDSFFERITILMGSSNNTEKNGFNIELLANMAQIDRISNIIDVIDEHKSILDKIFKSVKNFLETVNLFYSDSRKKITKLLTILVHLIIFRYNA